MKSKDLWTVVIVAIVVAVLASVVTMSISGNVIKVGSKLSGTKVYTKTEIDAMGLTTNQDVLNMLRTYDLGRCGFNEEPTGELWSLVNENYLTYTKPYLEADKNGDSVTTGSEWCESIGATCITGYSLSWISTQGFSGFVMNNPIGCAGGSMIQDLKVIHSMHNTYMCCSA